MLYLGINAIATDKHEMTYHHPHHPDTCLTLTDQRDLPYMPPLALVCSPRILAKRHEIAGGCRLVSGRITDYALEWQAKLR